MKKIMLLSALLIVLTGTAAVTFSLYSESQVNELARRVAITNCTSGEIKPFSLGDLLSNNFVLHLELDPDWINFRTSYALDNIYYNGRNDSMNLKTQELLQEKRYLSYKDGWRKIVIKNPMLLYSGLSLYGKKFIENYNKTLMEKRDYLLYSPGASWKFSGIEIYGKMTHEKATELASRNKKQFLGRTYSGLPNDTIPDSIYFEWAKRVEQETLDSLKTGEYLKNFSLKKHWDKERVLIDRYQNLIIQLLSLPDEKLNGFIRKPDTIFYNWMIKKNLVKKIDIAYQLRYPNDLLLLTQRIWFEYPEWTPRTFLNEALKFSNEVEKILPVYK